MKISSMVLLLVSGFYLTACDAPVASKTTASSSSSAKASVAAAVTLSAPSCNSSGAVFGGGDGSVGSPYLICSPAQLTHIQNYTASHFLLLADLDMSASGNVCITNPFTGTLDGQNHTISNLSCNSAGSFQAALFVQNQGTLSNLILTAAVITQGGGILAGENDGTISNCTVSGIVTGAIAGGLVGLNWTTGIINHSVALVTGAPHTITSTQNGGGLVGKNAGTVNTSRSSAIVYSTAGNSGGLVGYNDSSGVINNSYATGAVTATGGNSGGLVGTANNFSTITYSYAQGVTTGGTAGGLIGAIITSATTTNSYWNTTTSSIGASAAGTGYTTAQMQTTSNFVGWDLVSIWTQVAASSPTLR